MDVFRADLELNIRLGNLKKLDNRLDKNSKDYPQMAIILSRAHYIRGEIEAGKKLLQELDIAENSPYLLYARIKYLQFLQSAPDSDLMKIGIGLQECKKKLDGGQLDQQSQNIIYEFFYRVQASFLIRTGQYDESRIMLDLALQKEDEMDDLYTQSLACYLIGESYRYQGIYDRAERNYILADSMAQEENAPYVMALVRQSLGNIYLEGQRYSIALKHYLQSLREWEMIGNQAKINYIYICIGRIYRIFGNAGNAENMLQRSLTYHQHSPRNMSQTLYELVLLSMEIGAWRPMIGYLNQLGELAALHDQVEIRDYDKMANAIFLKSSGALVEMVRAQKMLYELHYSGIAEIRVQAMQMSIELLLNEYQIQRKRSTLERISHIMQSIEEHYQTSTYEYLGNAMFQAQLEVIHGNFKDAYHILKQLGKNAHDNNQELLAMQAYLEQVRIEEEFLRLADIYQENQQFMEGISKGEISRLPEDLDRPIMLLILDEGGIIRLKYEFNHDVIMDPNLLAALLSAISSFSSEAFGVDSSLDKIKYQDFEIAMKITGNLQYCYLFRGEDSMVDSKISEFTEYISNSQYLETILDPLSLLPSSLPDNVLLKIHAIFLRS